MSGEEEARDTQLQDGQKIVVTFPVRHAQKHVAPGTPLIVGKDIDLKEAKLLVGMKRATTDVSWNPPATSARTAKQST